MLHALLREIDALEAELAKGVRRTTYQGLPIHVEYEKGDVRSGESREGVKWSRRMRHAYGEILGTLGADGDPLDVYLGPEPYAAFAYVVQAKLPGSKAFDEVKIMLGFDSKRAAVKAFRGAYGKPGFFLDVTKWPMGALIEVVRQGHTAQQGRLDEKALRAIERMAKAKAKRPLGVPYEQPPGSGRWYEMRQVGERRKRVRVPAPHHEDDDDPEGGTRWSGGKVKQKPGRKPKPKRSHVKHWSGDEDPIEMDGDPHEENTVRLPLPAPPPLRRRPPPKGFRHWLADEVDAPPWLRRLAGVPMSKGLRRALRDLAVLEADLAKARQYHGEGEEWTRPSGQRVRKVGGKVVNVPKDEGRRGHAEGSDATAAARDILGAIFDRMEDEDEDQEWRFVYGELDPRERRDVLAHLAGLEAGPPQRGAARGALRRLEAAGVTLTRKPPKRSRLRKGMARVLRDLEALEAELAKAARYKPGEVRRRDDGTFWQKPATGGALVQVADMAGTPLGKRKKGGAPKKGKDAPAPKAPAPMGVELYQSLIGASEADIAAGMRVFGKMGKEDLRAVVDATGRGGSAFGPLTKKAALAAIGNALRERMARPAPPPVREPAPTGWRPGMPTAPSVDGMVTDDPSAPGIEDAITSAFQSLARGPDDFVNIADVRDRLGDYTREQQDYALVRMFREGRVRLIPNENPKSITDRDRAASFKFGDSIRHLMVVKG